MARHVWCRRCYSPIDKKQSNLSVRSQAFQYLSSLQRWKADPIRYLHVSYLMPYRFADMCLIFFFFFFICHLYLSVTRLGCSLNALSSTSRVDTPLTADWLQVCVGTRPTRFSKTFLKNCLPCLEVWPSMVTHAQNLCSAFNPSKCTHTRSSGQPY